MTARASPDRASSFIAARALVSNARVFALHGRAAERALRPVGPVTRLLLPDGERFKSVGTWRRLLDRLGGRR